MKSGLAATFAGLIAFSGATSAFATAQTGPAADVPAEPASLDGTWQGTIHFDKEGFLADTSTPAAGIRFRIEIHDVVVRVFVEEDGAFDEAKPGMFHIARVSANAVIFATQEGDDAWLESWCFVVTAKSKDLMIVEYARLVNNFGVPHGEKESDFATRGAGEFSRMGS
jgi:hypothetical protein